MDLSVSQSYPVILIVDDDTATRLMIRHSLERDGYDFLEATDGKHAILEFRRTTPDIVLMDAVMPVMDGFEACARLGQEPTGKDIPVLIITGLDDDSSVERAFNAGAKDFIPKPIHWAVLRQRVRRILDASRFEKHVAHLAYHDILTGLPNRRLFLDRLGAALSRARRSSDSLAVLFIDLDNFKNINDTMGHDAGDVLLQRVAERLVACVRDSDTVARLGGDEFTLLLEGIHSPNALPPIAENILARLMKPIHLSNRDLVVTASIGIALYPEDGQDIGTLMKNADTAMYRAKEYGRNRYQFYALEMSSVAMRRLLLESHLHKALERNEFVLHYQPRIEIETGTVCGVEALLRWQHPELGLVPPGEFIPLAAQTGQILIIGEWALRAACLQAKLWDLQRAAPLRISVNLASSQLNQPEFVALTQRILEETGLQPENLELELTEDMTMQRQPETVEVLRDLHSLGVRLTIDDFGTGYTSLAYLKRLPVSWLKIDQSFIGGIPNDPDSVAIVRAIISLGHNLGFRIVGEGVENEEQLEFLRRHRCEEAQGYFLERPAPAEQLERSVAVPSRESNAALPLERERNQ